ncbi:MAG: hypothetical protein U9O82_12410 [Thermodesulfobacteriota bacterium]|nr:hypothetical protein [Thermodesulfobacteriota bacterium]
MNTQQKKALILFGMHRSGISVLAGCLNLLGVNFGKAIRPGNQANQTGFFENQDIILRNDILLRDLECRWDMVGSLPSDWLERKTVQDARDKISTLIEKNFSGEEYWAIRDPRLCRLMPLWMDVFKQADIEPCFVLMVRHPFEVAKSLEKRDGFDLLKGHLLWLMHNREALLACSGHKYVILTYDGLLADPCYSMENISRELGIAFPKEPIKVYQKIIDFVRPDLKHQNLGPQDKNENDIFAQYAWLYDQFRLIQARALDTKTGGAEISGVIPCEIMDHDLAISSFPLVTSGGNHSVKPEASHVSEMFNNLLNVISRYEQADLNRGIQRQRLLLTADQQGGALYAQIYFPAAEDGKDYVEEKSQKILLAPDEWQQVTLDIPRPEDLLTGRLRLDPLNTRGMVYVSSIKLIHAVTGETCWSAQDRDKFEQCSVEGDGFVLSLENGLNMVCTGNDARIRLPLIPHLPDCPLRLEVWIKANRNQTALHDIWMKFNRVNNKLTGDLEEERNHLVHARKQVEELEGQLTENTTALRTREAEQKKQDALRQTQIEKLQQEITDKNQSLAEKTTAMQAKEADRKKQDALRQTQIEKLQQEWQAKTDEQKALLETEQQQNIDARKQVEDLEGQLTENTTALRIREAERKEQDALRQTQIEKLQQEWQAKTDEQKALLETEQQQNIDALKQVEELEGQLTENTTALRTREAEQKEQDALRQTQIEKLQQEITDKNQSLAELEKRIKFQEELSGQYHSALVDAELEYQKQADALEKKVRHKSQALAELEKRLKSQQELSGQYHSALVTAEQGLENTGLLNHENKQLSNWMRKLNNGFQALLASRRWKVGNAIGRIIRGILLRSKNPMVVDHISEIFTQFEKANQQAADYYTMQAPENQHDGERLLKWMKQLQDDFQALMASRRWRFGNAAFRSIEIMLFRRRTRLAPDYMKEIFTEFENWKQNVFEGRPISSLSYGEIKQLLAWMRKLSNNFQAMMASRRWRFGNATGRFAKTLLFQPKTPIVTDHMQKIFEDYRNVFKR